MKVMYSKDFYGEQGAGSYGLPISGVITSAANSNIVYQLVSYSVSNVVLLRNSADSEHGGATNGTLEIVATNQNPYAKLAILATSANQASTFLDSQKFSGGLPAFNGWHPALVIPCSG